MLQELTSVDAATWATASMLFFIAVYLFVAVRAFRAGHDELDARARLALDDAVAAETAPRGDAAVHG